MRSENWSEREERKRATHTRDTLGTDSPSEMQNRAATAAERDVVDVVARVARVYVYNGISMISGERGAELVGRLQHRLSCGIAWTRERCSPLVSRARAGALASWELRRGSFFYCWSTYLALISGLKGRYGAGAEGFQCGLYRVICYGGLREVKKCVNEWWKYCTCVLGLLAFSLSV